MLYFLIGLGVAELCPVDDTSRKWKSSDVASCQTEVTEYCSSRKGRCFELCYKWQIKSCHEHVQNIQQQLQQAQQRQRQKQRTTNNSYTPEPIQIGDYEDIGEYLLDTNEITFVACDGVQRNTGRGSSEYAQNCQIFCDAKKDSYYHDAEGYLKPKDWPICKKINEPTNTVSDSHESSGMCSSISLSSSFLLGMIGLLTVAYRREG